MELFTRAVNTKPKLSTCLGLKHRPGPPWSACGVMRSCSTNHRCCSRACRLAATPWRASHCRRLCRRSLWVDWPRCPSPATPLWLSRTAWRRSLTTPRWCPMERRPKTPKRSQPNYSLNGTSCGRVGCVRCADLAGVGSVLVRARRQVSTPGERRIAKGSCVAVNARRSF